MQIPGFDYQRVTVGDDVALNVAVGGSGAPIVLLHGFPQTHLMWRHVAADLAADHTVLVPDLRGYGASDKPADTGETYAKRTMAADVVAVARAFGHERFALAGHDRGALVAIQAGLDHPAAVSHLAILDVLPTLDTWDVLHGVSAAVGFHLYLMAQPPGLPETLIAERARRVLRVLPRRLDAAPGRDPGRRPRRVPAGQPRGRAVDRRGLPGDGDGGRRARHGVTDGGRPARHAGHRAAAGLGRRARLRRDGVVAPVDGRSAPPHGVVRALHGRGGTRRRREGTAGAGGTLRA